MAKLHDILEEREDKDHKDPIERSWSIAKLLWLPSVLGIVAGQDKFIVGGVWRDLYSRIESHVSSLVNVLVTDPAVSSMSGGKAISYFAKEVGSQLSTSGAPANAVQEASDLAKDMIEGTYSNSQLFRSTLKLAAEDKATKKVIANAESLGVKLKKTNPIKLLIFENAILMTEKSFVGKEEGVLHNTLSSPIKNVANVFNERVSGKDKGAWSKAFLRNFGKLRSKYNDIYGINIEGPVHDYQRLNIEKQRSDLLIKSGIGISKTVVNIRDSERAFPLSTVIKNRTSSSSELNPTGGIKELVDFLDNNVYKYDGAPAKQQQASLALEALHKNIFVQADQLPLYNQAYAKETLKPKLINKISKSLNNLQTEIDSFKNEINVLSGDPKNDAYKNKLEYYTRQYLKNTEKKITKAETDEFVKHVNDIKTKVYVKTDTVGLIPFQTLVIEIDAGKGVHRKVKLPFNLEVNGSYLPDPSGSIRSTFITTGILGGASVENAQTNMLNVADSFDRSWPKLWTDLLESDFSPDKANKLWRNNVLRLGEAATLDSSTPQDIIRSTKVVPEQMQALSGEIKGTYSKAWYRGMSGGLNAIKTLTKEFAAEVILDMEYSYHGERTGGIQKVAKDPTTRSYWLSYQVRKSGAVKSYDYLINLEESAWDNIKENVQKFMRTHGDDSLSFEQLEETLKKARDAFKEKGANPVSIATDSLTNNDAIKRKLPGHIYRSEAHAVEAFAKQIYTDPASSAQVLFSGHAISEADLPVLQEMTRRALRVAENDKTGSLNTMYLQRLLTDTSAESLIAKGNYFDTFSAARMLTAGQEQSLKLTTIFESLIEETIDPSSALAKKGVDTKDFFKSIHTVASIRDRRGLVKLLQEFPMSVKRAVLNWYDKDRMGLLNAVKESGHHAASFDTGVALFLKDLEVEKFEKLKFDKPLQYENMTRLGQIAKEVEKGRSLPWYHKIGLLDQIDLYSNDPGLAGNQWLYSSLYSFTPSQAAMGVGAALGIEKYLPFAMFSQLQKQRYQVAAARALAPGSFSKQIEAAGGRFPVLRSRLWDTTTRAAMDAYTNFKSTAEMGISSFMNFGQGSSGTLDTKFITNKSTALAWHLPADNRILGEDAGIALNRTAVQSLHSLPKGGSYNVKVNWPLMGANLSSTELMGTKPLSVVELLRRSGLREDTLKLIKAQYGNDTVMTLMKKAGTDDGSLILELISEQEKVEFYENLETGKTSSKFQGAIYDPDDPESLLKALRDKKTQYMKNEKQLTIISKLKRQLSSKIKEKSFINSIKILPGQSAEDAIIIFNFTPISSTSAIKAITEVGQFKSYIFGQTGGTFVADTSGASFLLTDKGESMDQFINKHMRRSLYRIWKTSHSPREQKIKIIKMLSEGFNLSEKEVHLMFDIKPETLTDFSRQSKLLANQGNIPQRIYYTIMLKDASKISLDKLNVFKSIHRMLESAGISQKEMKKSFIKMNEDRFKALGITKSFKKDLALLWDKGIESQEKSLVKFKASKDFNAKETAIVAEMHSAIKKKKIALSDMFLHIDESVIGEADVKHLRDHGMFNKDGTLHKSLRFDAMASLYLTDMAVLETTGDFRWMNGLARDSYGTPTKKTFSGWNMLLLNRQFSGSDSVSKLVRAGLMATSGHYDPNIRQGLRAHQKAILAIREGYGFGSKVASEDILSLTDIKALSKTFNDLKEIDGEAFGELQERLKAKGAYDEKYYSDLQDRTRIRKITKRNLEDKLAKLYGPDTFLSAEDALDMELRQKGDMLGIRGKAKKELLFLELPQLDSLLENRLTKESSEKLLKQLREIQDDFSEDFFRQIETTVEGQASGYEKAQLKQLIKDPGKRMLRDKVFNRLPLAHLMQEGPTPMGNSGDLFFFGRSKYQADLIQRIAEHHSYLESQIESALDGKTKLSATKLEDLMDTVRDRHKQFAKDISEPWTRFTLMGISAFEWKASQFYAEGGAPYQKAADILPVLKATIGKITGHSSKNQPELTRAVKDFVNNFRGTSDKTTRGTKEVLNKLLTGMASEVTTSHSLSGLALDTKLYDNNNSLIKVLSNLKSSGEGTQLTNQLLKELQKVTFGENLRNIMVDVVRHGYDSGGARAPFLATKGMGLGENLISSTAFDQWIINILKSETGLADLAKKNITAEDLVALAKGKANEKVVSVLKREPQFANMELGNISQLFVGSSQLFELGGLDRNSQRAIVFTNSLEQLLQRGDYDGDLVQRFLLGLNSEKIDKTQAAEALKRFRLKTAKRAILTADLTGSSDYYGTWADDLRLISDEALKKANGDYGVVMDHLAEKMEKTNNRLLLDNNTIKGGYMDHTERILSSLVKAADATSSLEGHATFMVQKLLTPYVGEQIHKLDKYYYGGDISNVEKLLGSFDNLKKDSKEFKGIFSALGLNVEDMKKFQGYEGRTEWDLFNEWRERKQQSIDFLKSEVRRDTGWLTSKSKGVLGKGGQLSHMDIFDTTYRAIAQFPITKDKVADLQTFKRNYKAFVSWSMGADIGDEQIDVLVNDIVVNMSKEARPANLAGEEGARFYTDRLKSIKDVYKHTANLQDMLTRTSNLFEDTGRALQHRNALGAAELFIRKASRNPEFYSHMYETLGAQNLIGVNTPEELASRFFNITTEEALWKRAAIEESSIMKSKLTNWLVKGKWSKRLAIGALAAVILDPNTNSIMLPDQRGGGEKHDWPSLHELTRSYGNRVGSKSVPTLRQKAILPATLDKLKQEMDLPKGMGSKSTISSFMPPPLPFKPNYSRKEDYRDNPLNFQEHVRKLNAILLR